MPPAGRDAAVKIELRKLDGRKGIDWQSGCTQRPLAQVRDGISGERAEVATLGPRNRTT